MYYVFGLTEKHCSNDSLLRNAYVFCILYFAKVHAAQVCKTAPHSCVSNVALPAPSVRM